MRTISVVRYLPLALFLLAISAASFAQIGKGIRLVSLRRPCPFMNNPSVRVTAISGPPVTGLGMLMEMTITGFPEPGSKPRKLATSGHPATGDGAMVAISSMKVFGARTSAGMAASTMDRLFGDGYEGGRWDRDHFYYNRSVNNVNVNEIHNVNNTRIEYNNSSRVSYNGGNGGINERPSAQEDAYSRERHIAPVATQNQHVQEARGNRELRASVNQGKPPIAATQRPGSFSGSNVVPAKEAGGRYQLQPIAAPLRTMPVPITMPIVRQMR